MIDIDFTQPIDQVRANIGDPSTEFVTDGTITSALTKYNNDILKTSLAVMELMLTAFATLADRSREGQVEVYYTNLFERYKVRFEDLKKQNSYKFGVPIIIGGVSLAKKNEVYADADMFTGYLMQDWNDIMLKDNNLYDEVINRSIYVE